MKPVLLALAAALTVSLALPALSVAQSLPADVNRDAPVTLDGVIDWVEWGTPHIQIHLASARTNPAGPAGAKWVVRGPAILDMLALGVGSDTLKPDLTISVKGYRLTNAACAPECAMAATTLTFGTPPRDYDLSSR